MLGREAIDLRDSGSSTILKNIPTSSSGNTFGLDSRIPSHDCVTLMFCSRSPAFDKYLHKETKEKCVYSSFFNPLRECGTTGALVLHPFNFFFHRGSTSCTLIYYTFFSTLYITILTSGLREQAINVTQS